MIVINGNNAINVTIEFRDLTASMSETMHSLDAVAAGALPP